MATVKLDTNFLTSAHPKKQVQYLQQLRDEGASNLAICRALTEAVGSKRLPTRILTIYFTCRWNKIPELAATAVKHGSGISLRRHAIRLAGRLLSKPGQWETMWKLLGGTEGLVALFGYISVHEVKLLSQTMVLGSLGPRIPAREQAIEGLLKALLPRTYPESEIQSQDKRPLQHLYARMLPACSAEFLDALLDDEDDSNPLYKNCNYSKLMKAHSSLMRKRVEEAVLRQGVMDDYTEQAVGHFLHRDTALAVRVISRTLESGKRWPAEDHDEVDTIAHHLQKAMKKSRSSDAEIRPLVSLTLKVAQAKRERVHGLWPALCSLWQRQPAHYEDLFVKAMSQGLAGLNAMVGSSLDVKIGDRCSASQYGIRHEIEWDWALLRLYCLHVPKDGIDIDTATDFKPLADRMWPVRIFSKMSREQAERILKGLYDVNPDYNFLDPASDSILQVREIKCMARRNFNVDLLMTMWHQGAEKGLRDAKSAVDKLRQKASTSKEQADRAEIARAASVYAIASGDLDLYLETITWQQKYVRDPLTVKTLYARDMVLTEEGIELLTGISEKLSHSMTLSEIAARIAKANEIIIAFRVTLTLARREPSHQERDWNSVNALAGGVLRNRALRMKELVKTRFAGKEVELFSVLWKSSLFLVEKYNENIQSIATFYENDISPASLATVTRIMLESVAEMRKAQTWRAEWEYLDSMSLSPLYRIAEGEIPEQGTQLILQTVLERPDASSLHRRLLSVGLLKSLPAADAEKVLLAFATGIGEKLEEQSYVKVGEPEPSKSAPSQPLVKVTTAKYLAQLLDNAEYISSDAAIEVLIELSKVGQHRDVRLATLDSLLNSLNDICNGPRETWRSNPFFEKILKALETIVPIAGSINERRPPQEEEWKEAAGNGPLPEITDTSAGLPPLLEAIVRAPLGYSYTNLEGLKAEFSTRLIQPILRKSEEDHHRWMALFLSKYGASFGVKGLPPTPISPSVWGEILPRYASFLPLKVLENYHQHIITTVTQTSELKEFNSSLRSDTALRNNPAIQHWLSIYDLAPNSYSVSGLRELLSILDHLYRNGSSTSRVIEMIVELVSLTFDDFETHDQIWGVFVDTHKPPFDYPGCSSSISQRYQEWKNTRRPTLEKVAELLSEGKRHQTRHSDYGRISLSVLELSVLLLPFPQFKDGDDEKADCGAFVAQLDGLILSSLQGSMSVLQWPKIEEATYKISGMIAIEEHRLRLALHVGRLEKMAGGGDGKTSAQLFSAANLVKLKTASTLIEEGWSTVKNASKGEEEARLRTLAQRLKTLVKTWQGSSDENIALETVEWRRTKTTLWTELMNT